MQQAIKTVLAVHPLRVVGMPVLSHRHQRPCDPEGKSPVFDPVRDDFEAVRFVPHGK